MAVALGNNQLIISVKGKPYVITFGTTMFTSIADPEKNLWYKSMSNSDETSCWVTIFSDSDSDPEMFEFDEINDMVNYHQYGDDGTLTQIEGSFLEQNMVEEEAVPITETPSRANIQLDIAEEEKSNPILDSIAELQNQSSNEDIKPAPKERENRGNNRKNNSRPKSRERNNKKNNNKPRNQGGNTKVVSTVNNTEGFNSLFYGDKVFTMGNKVDRQTFTDALIGKGSVDAAVNFCFTTNIDKLGTNIYQELVNGNKTAFVSSYVGYKSAMESGADPEICLAALLIVAKKLNVIFNGKIILIKLMETEHLKEVNDIFERELVNIEQLYICS